LWHPDWLKGSNPFDCSVIQDSVVAASKELHAIVFTDDSSPNLVPTVPNSRCSKKINGYGHAELFQGHLIVAAVFWSTMRKLLRMQAEAGALRAMALQCTVRSTEKACSGEHPQNARCNHVANAIIS
jgi:hypothetical protein